MIKKMLIANRGEIACRIGRTARKLGIKTVAPYIKDDLLSGMEEVIDILAPVALTDNMVSPYLNGPFLVNLALTHGCDAIHPGYGFLSENPEFSAHVSQNKLIFIGPKAEAIQIMANKISAKETMARAQVPVAPSLEVITDDQGNILNYAALEKIVFPVLVKAAFGGGGRGMRWINNKGELKDALEAATTEAFRHFASSKIYVEQAIIHARHIEVQIARDSLGQACHIYARDCSVQRRHQKVIEECPPINIPDHILQKMYDAALTVAHAIDYIGLGTVEFLLAEDGSFYFLEMNTRLQVEHGITELTTDLDLVAWQIAIAEGHKLPCSQKHISCLGHAIEARIYAEAPANNFMPSPGFVKKYNFPKALLDANTRIDHAFGSADQGPISRNFDPMVAKIMVKGCNRPEALRKLQRILEKTQFWGIESNLSYLESILCHDDIFSGKCHTQWLEEHHSILNKTSPAEGSNFDPYAIGAIISLVCSNSETATSRFFIDRLRDNLGRAYTVKLKSPDCLDFETVRITEYPGEHFETLIKGKLSKFTTLFLEPGLFKVTHDASGLSLEVAFFRSECTLMLCVQGTRYNFQLMSAEHLQGSRSIFAGNIVAPLDGTVTHVFCANGRFVAAGDKIVTLEAMKMEHVLRAPKAGTIINLSINVGSILKRGDSICTVTDEHERGAL